jgi:hypothetical protein
MLNFNDYQQKMNAIGFMPVTLNDYLNHLYYEAQWMNYFYNIFSFNQFCLQNGFLRIIIMEACPPGNFPHNNYIFDNLGSLLNAQNDKYLQQIYKGFFPNSKWNQITKRDALIALSQQNVLLLDLMPAHGFNFILNGINLRGNVNNNPVACCHLEKVRHIIKYFGNIQNLQIRSVFSMPPTYNTIALNALLNNPNHPIYCGTMTAGSGYPSFNLLLQLINNGF